ncbi:MAG: hypothetical protein O2973_03165 [Gemmatimonadetes bacterium]|nr:hypothetical protein [Gemmatimonadota bacterium]
MIQLQLPFPYPANPSVPRSSDSPVEPRRRLITRILRHPRTRRAAYAIAGVTLTASSALAQVAPNLHWQTIPTQHFEIVFSPGLEDVARRAGGSAERAYELLARELHPPRGRISIVVADNLDTSNGYASVFPTNRIVIYARPTVDANSLKFIDDWVDLVITHELAHIFHLDRSRGLWRLGQAIFGRNPFLFPSTYSPSWLSEGIAVHYETKLTGAGRAIGTDFRAIARAHDIAGTAPGAHELSAASPIYPLGNVAYAYGTPLVEAVVAAGGENSMRTFIDRSAGQIIPFLLNTNSQSAFGVSFDRAFRAWADSVHRTSESLVLRVPPVAPIAGGGWFSVRPRWLDGQTLIWAGADPKSVPSLRQVNAGGGDVRSVGVRNSNDVTTPLPGGWRVFAQQEYTGPYSQRTDLWIERDGSARRLTDGARLTQPDARLCGDEAPAGDAMPDVCIVAVQLLPGVARLVHVRATATSTATSTDITPLTEASAASLWTEPRWSHDGMRFVATHWERGGTSEIGVFDRTGTPLTIFGRSRAVNGSPAWGVGDTTIFFTSDRSGRSALYRANVATGALVLIADSPTGLFDNEPSPDGSRLATFVLGYDGLSVALVDANAAGTPADSTSVLPPSSARALATTDAPVGSYSAWRSMLPRYWTPTLEDGYDGAYRFGLLSSSSDLVGRHAWQLSATHDAKHREPEFDVSYDFAGLGTLVISFAVSQAWDHPGVVDSARTVVLPIERRRQFATIATTFNRRRVRNASALTVGGTYEWRDFRALDDVPFSLLHPSDRASLAKVYTYNSAFASVAFTNARHPYLALGPENGFSANATVRQRWRTGAASETRATSVIGSLSAYRGIDFGGRMHHLIAVRVAGATVNTTSATDFSAGGGSGSIVQVAPGVNIGEGRRTFFVRGFAPESQTGSRALGANVEYRIPIALPVRGLGALPVYFQRLSAAVFADGATAWCPTGSTASPICRTATPREWMGSAGAELHLDAAVQYDSPYRLRVGLAVPTVGRRFFGSSSVATYVTVGLPF